MTRNMDAGTDLNLIFAYYPDIPSGVSATLAEVMANDIPGRAELLAEEIVAKKPDFVGLQEVTLWGKGACGATTVLYDQLQLLLAALEKRDAHYKTVALNELTSLEAPANAITCVSFKDRNALLVRTEDEDEKIEVSNVQTRQFQATLDLSRIGIVGFPPIVRGYISADARLDGKTVRVVTTHLESTYPFDPTGLTQVAQADELIAFLKAAKMPEVLLGDFNSNAEVGPEQTASVPHILAAGLTDVWRAFNLPGTGFTWPLYHEDLSSGPAVPNERIDLIFTRGIRPLSVQELNLQPPWASDHAGVAATLHVAHEDE